MSRYLREGLKKTFEPVIQRSAYFYHWEKILLRLITDEKKPCLWTCISQNIEGKGIGVLKKQFHFPILNFHVKDYVNIIECQECKITPPHIFIEHQKERRKFSGKDLKPKFSCYIQAYEICINIVTEASLVAVVIKAMNGWAKITSRKLIPNFDTKSQCKLKWNESSFYSTSFIILLYSHKTALSL